MEIFLGKGGAGKSTLAAATALARAAHGDHVLLASIDQAHSLTEILDVQSTRTPGKPSSIQRVEFGLDVLEIDTLALLEDRYRSLVKLAGVGQVLGQVTPVTQLDPREIAGLPGVEPILALAELAELVADDDWDLVILDCPSTSDALSALTAPEVLLGYLERMWPREKRSSEALASGLRTALMMGGVERMSAAVHAIRGLLGDPSRTSVHLVTTPDRVSLAELRTTRSALALAGMRVSDIVVNRVVPDAAAHGWLEARHGQQQQVLADIRATVSEIPVQVVEEVSTEPIGRSALEPLASALPPPTGGVDVVAVSTVADEAGTAMRIFLPVADRRTVTLARIGSDLIVGADGGRRRIPLEPELRPFTVVGAEFDGQYLVVKFSQNV